MRLWLRLYVVYFRVSYMRDIRGRHLHNRGCCDVRGICASLTRQRRVSPAANRTVDRYGRVIHVHTRERLGDARDLRGPRIVDWLADVGRKVNDKLSMNDEVIVGFLEIQREHFWSVTARSGEPSSMHCEYVAEHTVTAQFQIDNISDSDVHDAEKPLIAFLKFSLVKNLNGDNGGFLDIAGTSRGRW
jgi:hypothetical protein